jgi:hypothetical protein
VTAQAHVPGSLDHDHLRDRLALTAETMPRQMVRSARTLLVYGFAALNVGALLGMAATFDVWLVALLTALVMFVLATLAALAALVGLIARLVLRPHH